MSKKQKDFPKLKCVWLGKDTAKGRVSQAPPSATDADVSLPSTSSTPKPPSNAVRVAVEGSTTAVVASAAEATAEATGKRDLRAPLSSLRGMRQESVDVSAALKAVSNTGAIPSPLRLVSSMSPPSDVQEEGVLPILRGVQSPRLPSRALATQTPA